MKKKVYLSIDHHYQYQKERESVKAVYPTIWEKEVKESLSDIILDNIIATSTDHTIQSHYAIRWYYPMFPGTKNPNAGFGWAAQIKDAFAEALRKDGFEVIFPY